MAKYTQQDVTNFLNALDRKPTCIGGGPRSSGDLFAGVSLANMQSFFKDELNRRTKMKKRSKK